jgi:hypothetical protein
MGLFGLILFDLIPAHRLASRMIVAERLEIKPSIGGNGNNPAIEAVCCLRAGSNRHGWFVPIVASEIDRTDLVGFATLPAFLSTSISSRTIGTFYRRESFGQKGT